jgi:hypothetical protein
VRRRLEAEGLLFDDRDSAPQAARWNPAQVPAPA